jgi:hypothetical protein
MPKGQRARQPGADADEDGKLPATPSPWRSGPGKRQRRHSLEGFKQRLSSGLATQDGQGQDDRIISYGTNTFYSNGRAGRHDWDWMLFGERS